MDRDFDFDVPDDFLNWDIGEDSKSSSQYLDKKPGLKTRIENHMNRVCFQCGYELSENSKFCGRCGHSLDYNIENIITEDSAKSNFIQVDYASILSYVDGLKGDEFEEFCGVLLGYNGYNEIVTTKSSGDHGIDLLARKDDIYYGIQCKCYSNSVGNKAIQEAYSGKSIYDADIAIVLTNNYYTKQAKEEAERLKVRLWDRDRLFEMCRNLPMTLLKDKSHNVVKIQGNNAKRIFHYIEKYSRKCIERFLQEKDEKEFVNDYKKNVQEPINFYGAYYHNALEHILFTYTCDIHHDFQHSSVVKYSKEKNYSIGNIFVIDVYYHLDDIVVKNDEVIIENTPEVNIGDDTFDDMKLMHSVNDVDEFWVSDKVIYLYVKNYIC